MHVLHVSDLHLGRDLGGISRRSEQERLASELADVARREAVDLVAVCGDVFDTSNPPAWAEDLYFQLLDSLGEGGRRAVLVIAGNHDHSVRLAAAEPLAKRQGIVLLGDRTDVPAAFDAGAGKVRIEPLGPGACVVRSADGERALGVGALPFCSEVALVRRQSGGATPAEGADRDGYGRALAQLFADRQALLPKDLPQMLAGHLWVSGGEHSASERVYRIGALSDLPVGWLPEADYVALGHLHRPQQVGQGPTPVIYAGSPIAYSVSEAGQQKRAVLVHFGPGRKAEWRDIPLASGRPVEVWSVRSMAELRERAQASGERQPIVSLTLQLGRAPSRAELEELHTLGPSFLAVEVAPFGESPDAQRAETALEREVPDEELVRGFLEQQLEAVADEALVEGLLALLQDGAAGNREAA